MENQVIVEIQFASIYSLSLPYLQKINERFFIIKFIPHSLRLRSVLQIYKGFGNFDKFLREIAVARQACCS